MNLTSSPLRFVLPSLLVGCLACSPEPEDNDDGDEGGECGRLPEENAEVSEAKIRGIVQDERGLPVVGLPLVVDGDPKNTIYTNLVGGFEVGAGESAVAVSSGDPACLLEGDQVTLEPGETLSFMLQAEGASCLVMEPPPESGDDSVEVIGGAYTIAGRYLVRFSRFRYPSVEGALDRLGSVWGTLQETCELTIGGHSALEATIVDEVELDGVMWENVYVAAAVAVEDSGFYISLLLDEAVESALGDKLRASVRNLSSDELRTLMQDL